MSVNVSEWCHEVSPRCHRGVTEVSQKCHRGVTKVSRGVARCREVSRGVTKVSRGVTRCQGDTRCHEVSQGVTRCHGGVTRCHEGVTEVSPRCHRGVTEVSRRCHEVSRGVKFCHVLSYGCQNADTLTGTDQTCPLYYLPFTPKASANPPR